MSRFDKAGTALRLLCLPLAFATIASCARPQPPIQKAQVKEMTASPEELRANIQAIQVHPSLQPGSNEAGPPIHVDPYPHSAGMAHDHDSAHR